MNLRTIPESIYHAMTSSGPDHPMISASLRENKTMSRVGLVKLGYMVARELAHFSMSEVSR